MINKKDYKKLFKIAIKELKNTVPNFRKSDYIFVVSGDVINEKIKYKGVDIRFDNRLNGETFYLIKKADLDYKLGVRE